MQFVPNMKIMALGSAIVRQVCLFVFRIPKQHFTLKFLLFLQFSNAILRSDWKKLIVESFFTGYTGSLCERPVCATNPCRYGGTCLGSNTGPGFLCLCPVGRGGALCQGKLYFVFYLTSNYCAKGVLVWSNIGIIALCWNLLTTGWAKLPWIPFRPNPLII